MTDTDENKRPSRQEREQARQQEARRALDRADMEGEALGTSTFARTANKARDHLGASDIDPDDPIEVWGTRIGRIGAAIFAIFLVLWLIQHFTR